jgi:hypothetical protein
LFIYKCVYGYNIHNILVPTNKCFYVDGKCFEKTGTCNKFTSSSDACTSDKNGLDVGVLDSFPYFIFNFILFFILFLKIIIFVIQIFQECFYHIGTGEENDENDICTTKLETCNLYPYYLCNDVATGIFNFI